MKKLFLLPVALFMLVGCNQPASGGEGGGQGGGGQGGGGSEKTVTLSADDLGEDQGDSFSALNFTKETVVFSFSGIKHYSTKYKEDGTTIDKYPGINMTKNSTLTISGATITKVVFTCNDNVTQSDGKVSEYGPVGFGETVTVDSANDRIGTWTGESASVTFTASNNQVRIRSLTVTVK